MSGHSKWHSIKHKKGLEDAKKGKIFTKHARLIALAAKQGGGDPELNPALRLAIDKSRIDNMPGSNIERAIKKGTGELKEVMEISEVQYEAFGPAGVALLIQAMTDNKNRTVSTVRSILTKHGGNMAGAGATVWMFQQKGMIFLDVTGLNSDDIQLKAIECGAEDVYVDGNNLNVVTAMQDLMRVKNCLEKSGVKINAVEIQFMAKDNVRIDDPEIAKKIINLMEALDDEEDVVNVASNFDIMVPGFEM